METQALGSTDTAAASRILPQTQSLQQGRNFNQLPLLNTNNEILGDSRMADTSPRTDTSTDVDLDDKNPTVGLGDFMYCSSLACIDLRIQISKALPSMS